MKTIKIRGAKTHNLQNVDLEIPRDKLVVITGLSGSGKSSLAFDTLYAEGQRRYVESLSSYARQFLSVMEKPDVDLIEGLSPAIAIEQKSTSHNPRSTVGTVTEIYDYLRLLFARVGEPKCPEHNIVLKAQSVSQILEQIMALPIDSKIILLAPIVENRKGSHEKKLEELRSLGYVRVRLDGEIYELDAMPKISAKQNHTLEVVIDRLKVNPSQKTRFVDSIETAFSLNDAVMKVYCMDNKKEFVFSAKFACPHCGWALAELEPRIFSFNSPQGACSDCDGLGVRQFMDPEKIIVDNNLSLSQGAIRGWDRNHNYYYSILSSLAKHYKFDLNKPFKSLSKKAQNVVLYGSNGEEIRFVINSEFRNGNNVKVQEFEGILPYMERRYLETDKEATRQELVKYLSQLPCDSCDGSRLNTQARQVFIGTKTLPAIVRLSIQEAYSFLAKLKFTGWKQKVASKILKELTSRLSFLLNVGLEYLSLDRTAETLSGGESQRIRLASQIGAGLVGVMYVLDEPSIGLHQRDNERLIQTLEHLRDLGNSVIVVEHDEEAILSADFVVDIGPGAGMGGGKIIAKGTPKQIMQNKNSLTGKYLSGKEAIEVPKVRKSAGNNHISIKKANANNLKNITVKIPHGLMTCVTGVSGSGKSTLINDTLYPRAAKNLNRAKKLATGTEDITGLELLDKVINITQDPIGRTPRSNAATYTNLFTEIRELFAKTEEARARGYKIGRFSFNVKGGRCEACSGDGLIRVEMHFLADIYVNCDSCHGKRYNEETLQIHYKGKNIHDVLEMTVEEGLVFFAAIPTIKRKLETLIQVGLGYLKLGQSATTLSGGEAQRIKLAKELSRRDTGKTLYILDEPTTGLHFHDIKRLLLVLQELKKRGNTIVIIEHNLDVIKTADYLIDLGPEGGSGGGQIVATGSPEQVAKTKGSYTGKFLKPLLKPR